MPRITILPLQRAIEARAGQTIMDAAHEAGLYWPTTCGGEGVCTTCACVVEEGAEGLEAMGRGERKTLAEERGEAALRDARLRLACQARVLRGHDEAPLVVRKAGVREV